MNNKIKILERAIEQIQDLSCCDGAGRTITEINKIASKALRDFNETVESKPENQ